MDTEIRNLELAIRSARTPQDFAAVDQALAAEHNSAMAACHGAVELQEVVQTAVAEMDSLIIHSMDNLGVEFPEGY